MNKNEILSTIMSLEGATMCRVNKTNFIGIPTEEGVVKVAVSVALNKDTEAHKAFNFDAAVADYKVWEAEGALREAEKANKPAKVKGVNPEAQARREAMDKAIAELPAFTNYTATEIKDALIAVGFLPADAMPMQVGQSALRLVNAGVLTVGQDEKGKRIYTKA